MKISIITLSIFLGTNLFIGAADNNIISVKSKFYNAYVTDNAKLWLEAMNELENLYLKTKNQQILFELTKSQYGYIGLLIDRHELETAKNILPKAEINAQKLVKDNLESADAHALLAGVYGFKIMLYPNYVLFNGPKGKNCIEKASSIKIVQPLL